MFIRTIFSLIFLAFTFNTLSAQKTLRNLEIGGGPGIFVYQGDLTPSGLGSFETIRPGFNIWAAKRFRKDVSIRVGFSAGSLRGDETKYSAPEYRQQRALKFSASVKELSALAVWTPSAFSGKWSPYALGGAGLTMVRIVRDPSGFNPGYFGDNGETTRNLTADIARPTPKILPVIPVGAGIRYAFSQRISAYAENVFRFTKTDYLDGFSKVANPDRKDKFHSTNFGIIYNFTGKAKEGCPVVHQ